MTRSVTSVESRVRTGARRAVPLIVGGVIGAVGAAASLAAGVVPESLLDVLPLRERTAATVTVPRFVDETDRSGLDHRYTGGFEHFTGGGVAVFDCDGDGRPDLFVAGGTSPATLHRNVSVPHGAIAFERLPSPVTDLEGVTGAYPLDIDGDGHLDLVLLRRGEDIFLRGRGDCTFEAFPHHMGLHGGDEWTVAFSATWEAGASLPTLAFGHYLDADDQDRARCDPNVLVRPLPTDATNSTRYGPRVPLLPAHCTLSLLFSDWDGSGAADLRVSNDRQYSREALEQLWRIEPGRPPVAYTVDDGWRPLRLWGMGIAAEDVTGNGLLDYVLTSQGDNKLQTLEEGVDGPAYVDIAIARGVTAHRPAFGGDVRPSTAWHPSLGDVNNNGRLDLHYTKGNVEAQVDHAFRDPDDLLLQEPDGRFVQATLGAGLLRFDNARGAALVDLNLDGALDLVVVHREAPVRIWRNVGGGTAEEPRALGRHVSVRLRQDGPNRDAIGAVVEVRTDGTTQTRHVHAGGGHAGGHVGWVHVGVGAARRVDLRVRWPDGPVSEWMRVRTDQFLVLARDEPPVVWQPGSRQGPFG